MNAGFIVAAPGDNEIGKFLSGFNKLFMHRLQHLLIAIKHHIYGTSTFNNITTDVTDKTHIVVSIHKYLEIHHVTQFLIV